MLIYVSTLQKQLQRSMTSKKITSLHVTQAQVHTYTGGIWIPLQAKSTTVSIMFDSGREVYRIMGVDNDTHTTTLNSSITPTLRFQMTSHNFGHWTDERTSTVYGIGFRGAEDTDAFLENLKKAQSAVTKSKRVIPPVVPAPKKRSYLTTNTTTNLHHPHGSRASNHQGISNKASRNTWSTDAAVAKLMEVAKNTDLDWKPTAFYPLAKINYDLPDLTPDRTSSMPPAPPSEFDDFVQRNPVLREPPSYSGFSDRLLLKHSNNSNSYHHQGGHSFPTPTFGRNHHGHRRLGVNATGDFFMAEESEMEDSALKAELHRVKDENVRLKKILIESSANLKKWELQMETIRSDNSILHQKLKERSSEVDELKKTNKDYAEAARFWKETIATNSANLQAASEKEQKIQIVLGENAKLRSKIKEMQEKRRSEKLRVEAALKEQEMRRAMNVQQLAAMEAYYREMLEKVGEAPRSQEAAVVTTTSHLKEDEDEDDDVDDEEGEETIDDEVDSRPLTEANGEGS